MAQEEGEKLPTAAVPLALAMPKYQLVKGDKSNVAFGITLAILLTSLKYISPSRLVKRTFQQYTFWNWSVLLVRFILDQPQWDPFLFTNSLSILLTLRTASAQGIIEYLRLKLQVRLGRPVSRLEFTVLDHISHTLPPILLLWKLVRRGKRISFSNGFLSLLAQGWFSFSQTGGLNAETLYCPHPIRRSWCACIAGHLLAPALLNRLVDKDYRGAALIAAVLTLPYLSTALDPNLRKRYPVAEMKLHVHTVEKEEWEDEKHSDWTSTWLSKQDPLYDTTTGKPMRPAWSSPALSKAKAKPRTWGPRGESNVRPWRG